MALALTLALASSLGASSDGGMLETLYVRGVYGATSPSAEINESADTLAGNAEVELERGSLWGVAAGVVAEETFVDVLVEGELTRRSADIERSILSVPGLPTTVVSGAGTEPVETWALMGNAWGRTTFGENLKPYAGGGIGAAYLPSGGLSDDGYYAFAWQLGAGLDYQFENGWSLGLGYRYFRTTASEEQEDPFFTLQVETETFEHSGMLALTVPLGREVSKRFGSKSQTNNASYTDAPEKGSRSWIPFTGGKEKSAETAPKPKAEKPGLLARATNWIPFIGGDEPANPPDTYDAMPVFPEAAPTAPAAKARPSPAAKTGNAAPAPARVKPAPTGMTASTAASAIVQLGAFSSRGVAEAKWAELSREAPSLRGATPSYQAITTKSQQQLIRLRVGPMSREAAKAVCAEVVGQCIIAAQ